MCVCVCVCMCLTIRKTRISSPHCCSVSVLLSEGINASIIKVELVNNYSSHQFVKHKIVITCQINIYHRTDYKNNK